MANQMKKRPMQKQAERLAAQGRYGDSMLVHMNPAEVDILRKTSPIGDLTINPQTGQPEAFIQFIAPIMAGIGAVKGGIDAHKAKKAAKARTRAIEARQKPFDDYTAAQIGKIRKHSAFDLPQTLADMDPSKVSFLPTGASQGFNLNYQNTPGTMFANYQPPNPFAMGDLPRQVVQQPVMQEPVDTDSGGETESEDVGGIDPDLDKLAGINAERKRLGYPEFESMEDFYDFISDISEGGPGGPYGSQIPFFNEGGIASLNQGSGSGSGGIGNILRNIGNVLGGMGGMGSEEVDFENMTREELIEYIKSLSSRGSMSGTTDAVGNKVKGSGSLDAVGRPTGGGGLSQFAGIFNPQNMASYQQGVSNVFGGPKNLADGGIMQLSKGDMVEDFPRMNGPISGPGTETSDDIPAMLSDGEFVVNAKAVRGIGKLKGADKSKAEQRREGAKMMYALQRAGEQAMRRS
tara:strand:- start:1351 stop:2736 length:1386 start_codon:yes stop_codon:yes gene_type:complete